MLVTVEFQRGKPFASVGDSICYRGLTSRLQDPVHLVDGPDRVSEVLEGRHADHEVERRVGKWHVSRVSVPDVDDNASRGGVFPGNPNERLAV